MTPSQSIDHLVFLAADLETGCREIERQLGVAPAFAGKHPLWGTQNSVLSLGGRCYLEVLAPDLETAAPPAGRLFAGHYSEGVFLLTWVVPTSDLERSVGEARAAGVTLGDLSAGERERPDGSKLTWRLSAPDALPLDGLVPFFLEWGADTHPSTTAPQGCRLVELRASHPEPTRVVETLRQLDLPLAVASGPVKLEAIIESPRGTIILS